MSLVSSFLVEGDSDQTERGRSGSLINHIKNQDPGMSFHIWGGDHRWDAINKRNLIMRISNVEPTLFVK